MNPADKHKLHADARSRLTRREVQRSRCLLRRLNFLEDQVEAHAEPAGYVLLEIESLTWILGEMGLLAGRVSRNGVK